MFKLKNLPLTIFSIVVISLVVGWGISMVLAWTEPSANPPSGNVAAPINVSSTAQTKSGNLTVPIVYDYNNTGYYVDPDANSWLYRIYSYDVRADIMYDRNNTGYYVDPDGFSNTNVFQVSGTMYGSDIRTNNQLCIRGDCRTSWPSGGGGGITCPDCDGRFVNQWETWNSNLTVRNTSAAANLALQYGSNTTWHLMAHSSDVFTIGQLGEYNFAISAAGRVGIGTTGPTRELDVVGYVKGRSGLCIGDDCRSSWPSGGGGGITCPDCDYRFQREIGSNCGSGDYVYGVADDGTLRCRADQVGAGGGGGDITAVYAGTGLSGGGTSGDVTLNADTGYLQRRVSGTCAAGSSIRVINADGSVSCEIDDVGGGGPESDTLQSVTDRGRSTTQWIQSPRFEDRDNSGYYVDPDDYSRIWNITIANNLWADNYLKVEGNADFKSNLDISGNLTAPNNSHDDCYWTPSVTEVFPADCMNNYYMVGMQVYFNSKTYRVHCCKL